MKSTKSIAFVGLSLCLLLLSSAVAQLRSVQATVPFRFTVGTHALPAGEYKAATVAGNSVLLLLRLDGPGSAFVQTHSTGGGGGPDVAPQLIFHRYRNHYFLSEVWTGNTNRGHVLTVSAAEREYAQTMRQETITVAALRLLK